jgi:hypothetical protein
LSEVAEIWSGMSFFCRAAMVSLSSLKHKYPYCGTSSSRFGHFTPKVGWQVTGDGWPGDASGRASERLVTGRRFLEPAASGVLEG